MTDEFPDSRSFFLLFFCHFKPVLVVSSYSRLFRKRSQKQMIWSFAPTTTFTSNPLINWLCISTQLARTLEFLAYIRCRFCPSEVTEFKNCLFLLTFIYRRPALHSFQHSDKGDCSFQDSLEESYDSSDQVHL